MVHGKSIWLYVRGREWSHHHPLPFRTIRESFPSYGSWCGYPVLSKEQNQQTCFLLRCSELYAARSLSTRPRHYTLTDRSIYIHTVTIGHIPTMTIGL